MANDTNKAYGKWTHKETSGMSRNIGDFTIWKNKPSFEVHYDWSKHLVRWWYTAQGKVVTSDKDLDDNSAFTIRHTLGDSGNLYQMNFGRVRRAKSNWDI